MTDIIVRPIENTQAMRNRRRIGTHNRNIRLTMPTQIQNAINLVNRNWLQKGLEAMLEIQHPTSATGGSRYCHLEMDGRAWLHEAIQAVRRGQRIRAVYCLRRIDPKDVLGEGT